MNIIAGAVAAALGAGAAYPIATWFEHGHWRRGEDPLPRRVDRLLLAMALAITCALLGATLGHARLWPAAAAAIILAVTGTAMCLVDLAVHRMPEPVTLATYGIVGGVLLMGAAVTGQWGQLGQAVAGGAVLWVMFFLYSLITGLGFADVQLLGIGGLVLGWIGWGAVLAGAAGAIFTPGLWAAVALLAGRRGHFAAGPPILLGILLAAAAAGAGAL